MGVYEELGVIPIVNAAGTVTRYGGSLMDHDVIDVMREASQQFCLLDELQGRAGIRIAEMLDVEAAYVTSSAACGLVLTAAACMAGSDPERISQLPDASGLKDEIIIQEAHRMPYDQSIRLSGAKLIQVGEGKAGPEQEMKSAINAQTAAVFYLANKMDDSSAVSFEDTIKIAHEALVPVIVDAASEAPPISTLSRFTRAGADLVIFSGGKSIRGPQSTGLVVGRTDLIAAIAANGVPFATIGRPMKVSREEIIAFIKALDLFLHRNHDADLNVWDNQLKHIETALASTEGVSLRRFTKGETYHVPLLALEFAEGTSASVEEIHDALLAGAPRIAVATHLVPGSLVVNPHSLQPGQERIVAERLKAVIEAIN